MPEIVPGPAPARDAERANGRLFLVGVAASLLLHGLIVALFIETPPRKMETPEMATPIEVVLVPPPQAPASEEEPAAEEPAPEPEPEPEPEQQEQEPEEPAPEPAPEAVEEEPEPEQPEPEAVPTTVPDANSLPVLQPVEEFAEEASEAAGGEEGDPLDGALAPAEDEPRPDEPAGEDGDAEDAPAPATEDVDTAEQPAADPATDEAPDTPVETGADPAEDPSAEDAPAEEAPAEDSPAEETPTEDQTAEDQTAEDGPVAEPAVDEAAPESDIIAGPEAEGETAPLGETAVEEASASAPEADGLSGAIATTLPRAKPTPPPEALRAASQDDLPPGVRLPAGASEPARRPGAPRLTRSRELFSDRILGDSRTRTAMAGMSGPQRLNLLCLTELRAQIRDLYPDRPAEILPSFRPQPGTVLAPVRAAYRSRGVWYDLDFRCETDPAVTRVEDFSFRVGPPVPRSQWLSRGFPQN
ncbi:MAG: hypothetical protein CML67_14065 [Rhodobacteraceae bacterium]|nr:hypothetical protein [Paracoccaceae bacterium]